MSLQKLQLPHRQACFLSLYTPLETHFKIKKQDQVPPESWAHAGGSSHKRARLIASILIPCPPRRNNSFTSRKNRGLSGCVVRAPMAKTEGKAQTRTKTLQLWNWYAEPIWKLHPGRESQSQQRSRGLRASITGGTAELGGWEAGRLLLTIVGNDGPGHCSCIHPTNHPEHTKPAQVLPTFLLGQKLRKVGEDDRDGTADPGRFRS